LRDLGVNDNNLYRWRGVYGSQHQQHLNGSRSSVAEMEAELKRLRREVEVLRQERDILKKAMSIVSRRRPVFAPRMKSEQSTSFLFRD
jgi:transposase